MVVVMLMQRDFNYLHCFRYCPRSLFASALSSRCCCCSILSARWYQIVTEYKPPDMSLSPPRSMHAGLHCLKVGHTH